MHIVYVNHEWKGQTPFEFETEEQAQEFKDAVNNGDLDVIVTAGDIRSNVCDLVNFEAV